MISRRGIRIKVLQAVYSQILMQGKDAVEAKKIYSNSIQEVLEVNLCYLLYIQKIFDYIAEYAKQQSEKFLLSPAEKIIDTSALNSEFYKYFFENQIFIKLIKKHKIEQYIQTEYVKNMFFDWIKTKEYLEYNSSPTKENEFYLLNSFLNKIVFKNEDLKSYLETYFANVDDDSDLVHFSLKRSIKNLKDEKPFSYSFGFDEVKKLEDFAFNLIQLTLDQHKDYLKIIDPKLKGWDSDRIPLLDMTLIKLAMSEMLHFPEIPLKVTVNEYIDLSKIFCSVKSKDFINGIMDRIMKELQDQGKIVKTGRGLD